MSCEEIPGTKNIWYLYNRVLLFGGNQMPSELVLHLYFYRLLSMKHHCHHCFLIAPIVTGVSFLTVGFRIPSPEEFSLTQVPAPSRKKYKHNTIYTSTLFRGKAPCTAPQCIYTMDTTEAGFHVLKVFQVQHTSRARFSSLMALSWSISTVKFCTVCSNSTALAFLRCL